LVADAGWQTAIQSHALGSAAQPRSEKPLLTECGAQPESPPFASSRLPEPPRLGYTDGNALAICIGVTEPISGKLSADLVPAQGFEPWTIGLKDRCSAKLSYAGCQ
jgi:hypothetical protein